MIYREPSRRPPPRNVILSQGELLLPFRVRKREEQKLLRVVVLG
jgi:hypothetical protein